ncbi:MAG: hypothetical protein ABI591_19495 [Kofleriaceae bacterium]
MPSVVGRDAMAVERAVVDAQERELATRRHAEDAGIRADLSWCVEVSTRGAELDHVDPVELPHLAHYLTVARVDRCDPTLGAAREHERAGFVDRDAARVVAVIAPRRANGAGVDVNPDSRAVPQIGIHVARRRIDDERFRAADHSDRRHRRDDQRSRHQVRVHR